METVILLPEASTWGTRRSLTDPGFRLPAVLALVGAREVGGVGGKAPDMVKTQFLKTDKLRSIIETRKPARGGLWLDHRAMPTALSLATWTVSTAPKQYRAEAR